MEILGRLSPEQFRTRVDEQEERIRATASVLPLYGLPGWRGARAVSRWTVCNGVLETAGLGHGPPAGPGPALEVMVSPGDRAPYVTLDRRREVRFEAEPPRTEEICRRIDEELRAETPEEITIPVDGTPLSFRVWSYPGVWIAEALHQHHVMVLKARGIEPDQVSLIRVEDVRPYLAGRREFLLGGDR